MRGTEVEEEGSKGREEEGAGVEGLGVVDDVAADEGSAAVS
jgi:hypothetical protein